MTHDREFAQVVAANQFEALQVDTQTEIDYLKMIEENTRLQIEETKSLISNLSNEMLVRDIYTRNELDKYQTDSSGYDYWTGKLNTGAISSTNIESAITSSASDVLASKKDLSTEQLIADIYATTLGKAVDDDGYWANSGISDADLPAAIQAAAQTYAGYEDIPLYPFADGGIVKGGQGGVIGLIGEGKDDELITRIKNPSDPLGQKEVINSLNNVIIQLQEQNTILKEQHQTLKDSEDIQSLSLEKLEEIEEAA